MKTGDKIRKKMEEKGFERSIDLYRAMKSRFKEETITLPSLCRILNNEIKNPKINHISKIATILKCPISEFYDKETKETRGVYTLYDTTNKDKKKRKGWAAKVVNLNEDIKIRPQQFSLKLHGKYSDQDKCTKWVFIYMGETILHLGEGSDEQKVHLKKGQHYIFNTSLPHYFEGIFKTGCRGILVKEIA